MPLIVYKSSAGSGKTTTLVSEYLKIALVNPGSFRNILAITFTNKAANEMKQRVITTLQELSDANQQPSAKLTGLIVTLGFDRIKLGNQAQKLLSLILHNYDEFAISTIDSFIHRIIRTFATDVQLPQNFEVVIDNDEIIPHIIQNLYDKVGSDKKLTKVLINFVLAEADEENSYDPTTKFVEFIKHHMNEDGFKHISKLDELNISELGEIIIRINAKIKSEKSIIKQTATKCIDLCHNNDIEISDFYGGKNGILGYFIKLKEFRVADEKLFPGKNILKTIEEDKWFGSKTTSGKQQSISNIIPELTSNYHTMQDALVSYFYFRLLHSKIYSLALVHEIRNLFIEFTDQTGKVHISEFNKKISSEIANQPVPFIYERLGRKYQYFLIDEFQDTSILQWYNLLPLIEESLSYGNINMLVGDAKQAIYRFRSGEVELFANLPNLYENDGSQLSLLRQRMLHREYEEVILSTNWRSFPEIINFNNSFFETITENLSARTKLIYENHKQVIPDNSKNGGQVSLNFIHENDAELYEEEKLIQIQGFIEQLKENKFKEKDICILCRTKNNAAGIASFLLDQKYNVVSSESLLLNNSANVRLIIAFFKLLVYPDNELAMAEFMNIYLKLSSNKNSFDDVFRAIRKSKAEGIISVFNFFKIDANYNDLIALSTYETAEFVIREVLNEQYSDIFLQYLLDYIFDTNLPLDLFIDLWEKKKDKTFITMPEDIDAIQIMTIHKAKGLDFPAVIVDAAMLKQQNTKTEYWENINLKGFKELKVGLFPLSRKIEHINRLQIYEEEVAKTELDFLNLIYVAFTRPVKALYTIGQIKNNNPKDKFTNYLVNFLKSKGVWDENKLHYNFGELTPKASEDKQVDENPIKLSTFISSHWQELISIASTDDINNRALESISSQSYGKLIHMILSEIRYDTDIPIVITSLTSSGILNTSDIKIIESIINNIVTHPKLQPYYKAGLIIKNETEIMLSNGELIRPDRVTIDNQTLTIIDYKTGDEKQDDHDQVIKYKLAFEYLGYKSVKAKIIYIGDIIRVVNI
ncbi:MAG: UvrD-helicase domain-containing protein [Bacteroidota bacterium]